MDLSPTGRVILGFLSVAPRSGYDIKQVVDNSTRFFWAASYGQIYPELKRLTADGLVEAIEDRDSSRKRVSYRITATGSAALREWIERPEQVYELRDEGLLKLFFAGTVGDGAVLDVLERKRERHLEIASRLREIEPFAATTERDGPLDVLRYGLALHEFSAQWCERALNERRSKN